MVEFRGLAPWPEGIEVVEAEVGGKVVDLHNDATLTAIEIGCRPVVELVLRFRLAGGRDAALTFGAVTGLMFRQDEVDGVSPFASDWDPEVVETFFGVEFTDAGDGSGRFEVGAITGVFTFAAKSVTFEQVA